MSSNTKKLIILVIGILLLSGFLSMVCGFSSLGFSFLNRSTSRGAEKTFQIRGNYSNIDIESETGNIRIHDAGKDQARVVWSGSSVMKLSVLNRGGTLKVTEKYRLPWFLRIGVIPGKSGIDVYLSQRDHKRLEIESDNGNINVPAGFSFSEAEIESDTGSVTGTLLTEKVFTVKSSTGRIDVPESAFGGECRIKTDTGSITITIIGK